MIVTESDLEKAIVYWGDVKPMKEGVHSYEVSRLIEVLAAMRFNKKPSLDIPNHHIIVPFVIEGAKKSEVSA